MILYQIKYTSILTGIRETYMNVGFKTPELAKDEIKRLMRDAKKYKKQNIDVRTMSEMGIRIPTSLVGKYWKVKKVKCKPI